MLDFRFQGFDILPDIVGYFLIYSGLKDLTSQSRFLARAGKYTLPLIILSLFDLYQAQQPGSGIKLSIESWPFMIIGLAVAALNIMMVHQLCAGIVEMARARRRATLRRNAETRWKLYLYTNLALLILTPLVLVAPFLSLLFFLPLFVMMVVVIVLMAMLMKQAGQDLHYSA